MKIQMLVLASMVAALVTGSVAKGGDDSAYTQSPASFTSETNMDYFELINPDENQNMPKSVKGETGYAPDDLQNPRKPAKEFLDGLQSPQSIVTIDQ